MKISSFNLFVVRCWRLVWLGVWCAAAQANPLFDQVRAQIVVGDLEQALVQIQSTEGAELSDDQVSFLMGEIYGEIGQFAKAKDVLATVQVGDMHALVLDKQLTLTARHQSPREVLQALKSEQGKVSDAQLKYLALASLKTSGSGTYLKQLKTLARDKPNDQAALDLAWVYQQMGAYADAIQVLSSVDRPVTAAVGLQKAHALALAHGQLGQRVHACAALQATGVERLQGYEQQLQTALITHYACPTPTAQTAHETPRDAPDSLQQPADNVAPSAAQVTPLARHALDGESAPGLTLRAQGAYDGGDKRVNYYDRNSDHSLRTLPIPEGVAIMGASGILVGGGRYVVTNRHVVENGQYFAIKSALGGVSKARLIKVSEASDLALLEMESPFPQEQAIGFNEFANAKAGSQIYSIGYPLWYLLGTNTPSIANGLVAKNYGMNDDPHMFQITAKVNKGNSGGPVFDSYGRLIGITTAKLDTESLRRTEGVDPEGINFIYHAKEIVSFAGPVLEQGQRRSAQEQPLAPERLYELRLGAAVMVAVGK